MALTLPSMPAGHKILASDFTTIFAAITQAYGAPLVVVSDQSVTNSTTLTDITAFTTPVTANTTYRFFGEVFYSASTTADFKLGMSVPASATARWGAHSALSTDTAAGGSWFNGAFTESSTPGLGGVGAATVQTSQISGTLVVAGTAGTFKFQMAQSNLDAVNATTLYAKSILTVWQI